MLEFTNRTKIATRWPVTWLSWLSYRFTANPTEAGLIFQCTSSLSINRALPSTQKYYPLTKGVLVKHDIKKSLIYQNYFQYIN